MIYINAKEIIFYDKYAKLTRLDGPAHIQENFQSWWVNGIRHREDGPAVIGIDYQVWYQNGKCHRLDGPAIIDIDYKGSKRKAWYIEGKKYNETEYHEKLKEMGLE